VRRPRVTTGGFERATASITWAGSIIFFASISRRSIAINVVNHSFAESAAAV
jgi:hypothetical protein